MQRLCHPGPCLHTMAHTHSPSPSPSPSRFQGQHRACRPCVPSCSVTWDCNAAPDPLAVRPISSPPDKVLAPEEALGGARIGGYLAPSMLWRPLVLGCGVTGQGGASHR